MIKKKAENQNTGSEQLNDIKESVCDNSQSSCDSNSNDTMSEDAKKACDNSAEVSDNAQGNEAEEWRDRYLRLSAEFDNYRKRTLKEKADLVLMGGEGIIKEILPVLDDMDRALEVMQSATDIDAVRSGIELISYKLREMLKANGLKEILAIGSELDTDFHEAVAKTPAPDKKGQGKIIDVAQKGYTYKDKVIRHAKVVVGE